MLVVDAHLDIAMNAMQLNRDLQTWAHTIRSNELGTPGPGRAQGAVAIPDMRCGRLAVSVASIFARSSGTRIPHLDFASASQAYAVARGHLAYYAALQSEGLVRILMDSGSLSSHLAEWRDWEANGAQGETPLPGLVVGMEGADPLLSPESIAEWHSLGVRVVGLSHDGVGIYAGGTGTELGLTELGKRLLTAMAPLGMALDLSHASDRTFEEALAQYSGPVLASHSNCRQLVPHPRLLDNDQLRAVAERDGVIGISLVGWQLRPGRQVGRSEPQRASIIDFADHIDHVCQTVGSCNHVGIGSNLAATLDLGELPCDIDTVADLQSIAGHLADRGYSSRQVEAVMHGNWLRLLEQVLLR